MFLRCPLCGAEYFYIEDQDPYVSFRINAEGQATDPGTPGDVPVLSSETIVHCVTCAWYGEVRELKRPESGNV